MADCISPLTSPCFDCLGWMVHVYMYKSRLGLVANVFPDTRSAPLIARAERSRRQPPFLSNRSRDNLLRAQYTSVSRGVNRDQSPASRVRRQSTPFPEGRRRGVVVGVEVQARTARDRCSLGVLVIDYHWWISSVRGCSGLCLAHAKVR